MHENSVKMVLCKGRHTHRELEGLQAIFPSYIDPLDFTGLNEMAELKLEGVDHLDLYVTGLASALAAVLTVCTQNLISCSLWHFDRDKDTYIEQKTATKCHYAFLHEGYV